jgi:predicted glycogen debranching enzyme
MSPAPGERVRRFVGDRLLFTLTTRDAGQSTPSGWGARLRTNLGRADVLGKEIIQAHASKLPLAGASWRDLPMRREGNEWRIELPLTEPGYFKAKGYLLDPNGWQHWPDGPDIGIAVHPDAYRTANTIYCAFTRMFGASRTQTRTANEKQEQQFKQLDQLGYTVIPPSGKFRDLIAQLPHIIGTLGCRILHLLPVNPVPTTFQRLGRFGSPYACLDLTAIDPALVEFDRRTTGVDQFRELTYAAHLQGARVFLDMVVNHTGWGSVLQENHPEWFLRDADGRFVYPGAWGTVWEDLVELEHRHLALWDEVAEAFLCWCRRGVDGFRCDAGYKVPLAAWQYITACVRREFPDTIFLLEGLGGAWEITDQLLTEGGMQWAYSELFQNYSGTDVANYLDHSFKQTARGGLLVHYSETHDNERLASRSRDWSLLRNRLCALASVSGGFGFTCGVEWLAPERVNVHSSRGLAWGSPDNIIPQLAQLNRLLAGHPCFFDGAKTTRVSPTDSPIYVLRRDSLDGADSLLALFNNDDSRAQTISLDKEKIRGLGEFKFELLDQPIPAIKPVKDGGFEISLKPGASACLSARPNPSVAVGENYRRARAQAAWAMTVLGQVLSVEEIPALDWRNLANLVEETPGAFLGACCGSDSQAVRANIDSLLAGKTSQASQYAPVVKWTLLDTRRVLPVPPGHWLLLQDEAPFRAALSIEGAKHLRHAQSIAVRGGHVACFAPAQTPGDATLSIERYAVVSQQLESRVRFLAAGPVLDSNGAGPLAFSNLAELRRAATASEDIKNGHSVAPDGHPLALLTNGIGGMARLCVEFGAIRSKYDCLLGANLHPRVPVDRHIFAKRARVWVNADGFITPLDLRNLASFEPGPPARWYFIASAGDGRTVEIQITARMLPGRNTTVLHFTRPAEDLSKEILLPQECDVRLTIRVDIEDRNFHWETKRNPGADHHFSSNTRPIPDQSGFAFTPASDRQLRVFTDAGVYHPQPEWCENIPHPVEQSRGQTASGDAYSPGWFELPLIRGASVSMTISADTASAAVEILMAQARPATSAIFPPDDAFGLQLLRGVRDYVVRRDDSVTVIAGYPWFLDWGRDSLICARGLLAAGMIEEVMQILVTFGRFAQNGTLPNTIHGDDASNRDTSDAPLWYGIVCEELAAEFGGTLYGVKVDGQRSILDVLRNIASGYVKGTPNGIRMDAASSLIFSPSHFTWMDTNYPAATPREGYPVEIQVLWIRLLRQLQRIDQPAERARWQELAERAEASFNKYFWLEDKGWFADLLAAKPGQAAADATVDDSLRSNGLFAVSLGLVSGERARRCVEAAARYLIVPGALRTLAPLPLARPQPVVGNDGRLLNNPAEPYWGCYQGDEDTRRKPAYHNGTAWTWTFPSFCEALARAYDNSPASVAAARAYLGSMDQLLMAGCLGQIPEILDGDTPHIPRGCDAQAWGMTEALRVWKLLQNSPSPT